MKRYRKTARKGKKVFLKNTILLQQLYSSLMFTFFIYPAEFAIETSKDGIISQHYIAVIMAGMDLIAFFGGLSYVHKKTFRKRDKIRCTPYVSGRIYSTYPAEGMARSDNRIVSDRVCQRPWNTIHHIHCFTQSRKIRRYYGNATGLNGYVPCSIPYTDNPLGNNRSCRHYFSGSRSIYHSLRIGSDTNIMVIPHKGNEKPRHSVIREN